MEFDQQKVLNKLDELASRLPAHGRVLILPHDYPDPDALASAAVMHLLLAERFKLQGQIVFTGMVSRSENKEMLSHIRYARHLLDEIREPRKKIPCLLVDSVPWSGNVTVPDFAKPIAVFDHHPVKTPAKYKDLLFDIRQEAGATVTILYQYLTVCNIAVPSWLATLMVYAIATETLDLSRKCTEADLQAYLAMLARGNMTILGKIRHARLPRVYYAQIQEAMKNVFVYGRVAWSHLNDVRQPEIVPEIAELLLRMERITWSFCTAYQGDNLVISLRSSHPHAHCGKLLKRLVRGIGSAGGHEWMAGGVVDMKDVHSDKREEKRLDLVKALVAKVEKRSTQSGESLEDLAKPLAEVGG